MTDSPKLPVVEDRHPVAALWLDDRRLQRSAHFATIFAGVAAAIALLFGAWQLRGSAQSDASRAHLEREMAANGSWERFMELSSEKPKFAAGFGKEEYQKIDVDQRNSYIWFVERMLFASEQILSYDPSDAEWQLAIQEQARVHASYIQSNEFLDNSICSYTAQLRNVVANAFKDSSPLDYAKLHRRDDECNKAGYSE